MGKDWHWGGRSTKRGGGEGGGRPEGGGGGATTSCGGDKNNSATPSGCMSAVLQFFDFHQFQFVLHQPQPPLKPHSFLPEDPTLLKGLALIISFPSLLLLFQKPMCDVLSQQLFLFGHALFFSSCCLLFKV